MKKVRSKKKSSTRVKIKFDPKSDTVFEKDTTFENRPFKIKGTVNPKNPTIQLKERENNASN